MAALGYRAHGAMLLDTQSHFEPWSAMKLRSISSSQFENFLRRLSPDRDEAGRQYEQLRRRLIALFTYRKCAEPDALADETLDRVALKIEGLAPPGAAADAARFAFGVAWNVARESFHAPRTPLSLSDTPEPPDPAPPFDDRLADDVLRRCLQSCLRRLTAPDRELVLQYFRKEKRAKIEHRLALAMRLQITPNALRLRVSRITSSLRDCTSLCTGAGAGGGPPPNSRWWNHAG